LILNFYKKKINYFIIDATIIIKKIKCKWGWGGVTKIKQKHICSTRSKTKYMSARW